MNWIFKSPRTTAERRAAISAIEQGVHVRPARTDSGLPNAWDDVPKGRRGRRKTSLRDHRKGTISHEQWEQMFHAE
jgi:hypothetical protein